MSGNPHVAKTLAKLFGSDKHSDCVIHFCLEDDPDEQRTRKRRRIDVGSTDVQQKTRELRVVGDPLPGHTFLLQAASDQFDVQIGWNAEADKESDQNALGGAGATGGTNLPVLRVVLGSEEELPSARAAIAFAYTGEVKVGSVREALELRQQGRYLQIKGCAAACVGAIRDLLSDGSVPGVESRDCYHAALELFACGELWPETLDEDGFSGVLQVAKQAVVSHFGDALATLNTPSLRQQLLELPAAGLEALLESDDFGTDNESSILLLLATWVEANYTETEEETRRRLCWQVRLVQLSRPYLSQVLPALALDHGTHPDAAAGWFPISSMEAAFIASFRTASPAEQEGLRSSEKRNFESPWYNTRRRRQCVPAGGITYPWHITQQALVERLQSSPPEKGCTICTEEQLPDGLFYGLGFSWRVALRARRGEAAAGTDLKFNLPNALKVQGSHLADDDEVCIAAEYAAVLKVHRYQGARKGAVADTYDLGEFREINLFWGIDDNLPLRKPTVAADAGGGDILTAWAEYIRDGKVTGTVTMLPCSQA